MSRGVDQPSWVTWVLVGGPQFSPGVPGDSGPGPRARGVVQLSWGIGPVPKAPWGHSAVQGHSGPVPRAHGFDNWTRAICAGVQWLEGVDQHCGVTWDRSRTPTGLTNCPERLWPGSNAPRVCPGLPGDWGPCPRPRGVSRCAGRLRTGSEDLRSQTALSGHSQLCPRAGGVDQLSWVTGARDRRPSGSTSSPRPLALAS